MITIDSNILVETEFLGSNNSIVCTPEGLVCIDSPHRPSDAMVWRRTAESCGEVLYLLNTDHHPDHTIGNYWMPGRVVGHAITRELLLTNPPTRQNLDDLFAVIDPAWSMYASDYRVRVPTLTFTASFTLHLGGLDFAMTHLPGHTLNSTLITIPQQGVVFTGDLVCEAGLPAFIEADTFAWIDAVRAIEAMDIRTIVPGHGKVCGKEMATTFRGWMEDLVGEVERRIDKGVSREVIAREVSYEDRIHIATGQSPGYPKHLIDLFMTKSIETIHDHILQRRARSG